VRGRAALSAVEIRPDEREVTVTYLSHLRCHLREHRIRGAVVREKQIVPLGTRAVLPRRPVSGAAQAAGGGVSDAR
jgi:hypothetical protein